MYIEVLIVRNIVDLDIQNMNPSFTIIVGCYILFRIAEIVIADSIKMLLFR